MNVTPAPREGMPRWHRRLAGRRRKLLTGAVGVVCASLMAVPPAGGAERLTPDEEGRALAAEVRTQKPPHDLSTPGVLRRRDADGKWGEAIAVRLDVIPGGDYWQSRYLALGTNQAPFETLTVTHADQAPNRYDHSRAARGDGVVAAAVTLTGEAAAVPFAGSDFWLSDLGLEFLHWPQQRVLKHEMRKGRSCKVLESLNPKPAPGGYARVLSWVDIEHRGILRAEAFDPGRKLVKEFSIGGFTKVDGRWQLKSMEIRNEQNDARTRLEFDFEIEDRPGAPK